MDTSKLKEDEDPGTLLGDIAVDANNAPKPMLAKSIDGVSESILNKE